MNGGRKAEIKYCKKKKRKDAPFALVAQEILRVLGAVNQEPKTTYIFFCHKS